MGITHKKMTLTNKLKNRENWWLWLLFRDICITDEKKNLCWPWWSAPIMCLVHCYNFWVELHSIMNKKENFLRPSTVWDCPLPFNYYGSYLWSIGNDERRSCSLHPSHTKGKDWHVVLLPTLNTMKGNTPQLTPTYGTLLSSDRS